MKTTPIYVIKETLLLKNTLENRNPNPNSITVTMTNQNSPVKTIAFTSFLFVASSNFSLNPAITETNQQNKNKSPKQQTIHNRWSKQRERNLTGDSQSVNRRIGYGDDRDAVISDLHADVSPCHGVILYRIVSILIIVSEFLIGSKVSITLPNDKDKKKTINS